MHNSHKFQKSDFLDCYFINSTLKFIFVVTRINNQLPQMQTSKITRIAVIVLVLLFLVLSVISCSTHTHTATPATTGKKIPPGQAKKASGSQSAKAYAPGQQKKR